MQSYTGREMQEIIDRNSAAQREAMLIDLCVVALSGGAVGAIFGWLARGWLQ